MTIPTPGTINAVAYGSCTITVAFPSLVTYTGTVCSGGNPSCPIGNPAPSMGGRSRQAKWAVLSYDSGVINTALCLTVPGAKERDRNYDAYDDFGRIPNAQYWKLNETPIGSSCGAHIDGDTGPIPVVTFQDVIANCSTTCTLTTTQVFVVGPDQPRAQQVRAKDSPTATTDHVGWTVDAIYNNITITDN